MKYKISVMLSAMILLLCLVACGSGTDTSTTPGGTEQITTGEVTTPFSGTDTTTVGKEPVITTVPDAVPPLDVDWNEGKCSHRYTAVLQPATAISPSYTKYTCDKCGHSYKVQVGEALSCPIVEIRTQDNAAIASKDVYVNCTVTLRNTEGRYAFADSPAGIRLRGNSTASGAKKPYRIKFDTKVQMLGLGNGEAKSWLLMADYYDHSMMRNYMTHALGRSMDAIPFACDGTFVEVYLNNAYIGVYYLCEQVQVQSQRIDIDTSGELDPTVVDTGFLLEMEQFSSRREGVEGIDYFRVPGTNYYYMVKSDARAPEQVAFIQKYLGEMYAAISSGNEARIREYLNVDSAVDMYILQLLASDPDSTCTSMFIWKDVGGVVQVGAPWDFDIAWGNYNTREQTDTEEWMFPLLQQLYRQPWFYKLVCIRWEELRDGGMVEFLFETVTDAARDYRDAFDRNYEKWNIWGKRPSSLTTSNALAFTCQEDAIRYLFKWIAGRVAWIDGRLQYPYGPDYSEWFEEQ